MSDDLSIFLLLLMPVVVAYPIAFWLTVEDLLSIYPLKTDQKVFLRTFLTPRSEILVRILAAAAFIVFVLICLVFPAEPAIIMGPAIFLLTTTLLYFFSKGHFLARIESSLQMRRALYKSLGESNFEEVTKDCLEVLDSWRNTNRRSKALRWFRWR